MQAVDHQVFAEIEAGFPLEDPGQMFPTDEAVVRHVPQREGVHVPAADIFDRQFYHGAFALGAVGKLTLPGYQQEQLRDLTFNDVRRKFVRLVVLPANRVKNLPDGLGCEIVFGKHRDLAKYTFCRGRDHRCSAVNEQTGEGGGFVICLVDDPGRKQGHISRGQAVGLVVNKEAANAIHQIIDFPVAMVVVFFFGGLHANFGSKFKILLKGQN